MNLEFDFWGKRWFEALPLGNGHIGAMVYGNPCTEYIDLSENTFFSGDDKTDNNQAGADKAFQKVRELLQKGEHERAREEAHNFIGIRGNYGTNIPVGRVIIDYGCTEDRIKNYKRSLNLLSGMLEASYEREASAVKTECFASHTDKLFAYRTEAEGRVLNMSLQLKAYTGESRVEYQDKAICFYTAAREKLHSDGSSGTKLFGVIRLYSDGVMEHGEEGIGIKSASFLLLMIKLVTDYDNPEFERQCAELKADGKETFLTDYPLCREAHRKDMEGFLGRSRLTITGERQAELDRISLMYQYGRYLLLSSSREDSRLPAHLQGIWNDNVACRIGWTCDMHLDINTQMNYWLSEVTSLPEVNEPLFRWIREKLMPSGRIAARKNYGLEGWVAELVSNSWGFTAPYWAEPLSPCPTGGVWILTHIWEHYLFSERMDFLKENFQVLQEAVRFFADYVFWEEEAGCYTSGPSISPENSYLDEDGNVCHMDIGCTYEIVMIRELFRLYLEASDALKLQEELTRRVQELLEKLRPYPVLKDGSLGEWSRPWEDTDPQHRHTSHLLGVFPYAQITPEDTPELSEAVKRTLDKKLCEEEKWEATGWARNMLILYYARLQEAGKAYYHIGRLLDQLLEKNYLIYHPPTRGAMSFDNVYELDGNTGLTAAIAEMLLQSHNGSLHILPALPMEWKNGFIKGLRARGNITADISWRQGELEYIILKADRERECPVRYRNIEKRIRLKEKQETMVCYKEGELITGQKE